MKTTRLLACALAAAVLAVAPAAHAQLAISVNDNKVMLVNGTTRVVANAPADTITLIDLNARPAVAVAEIVVPGSVVGRRCRSPSRPMRGWPW